MRYANFVFWIALYAAVWTVHWHSFWDSVWFVVAAGLARCLATNLYKRFDPGAGPNSKLIDILGSIRARHKIPALAAAIVSVDGSMDMATTGVRKLGTSFSTTTEDLWHLGSCTKAMTALLAGTFVSEGKLAWKDKAMSFFPDVANNLPARVREVTIEQLLSHRAGMAENYPRELASALIGPLPAQRMTVAHWMLKSPAYRAGSYHYSNGGYVVIGSILEKLSGKSWEELMRERIFAPLGMISAGFGGSGTIGEIDQPWPHLPNGRPAPFNGAAMDNLPYMGPAGTVHASMVDWGKFLTDQMRGGSGRSALLPNSIYAAIQKPAVGTYGFGWIVVFRHWARGKMLSHAGSNTMNYAACWLGSAVGYGVLVCTNQGGKLSAMSDEVAEALLRMQKRRLSATIGRSELTRKERTRPGI